MTIYAILPDQPDTAKLRVAIATVFKDSHFALDGTHGWFVSATGTATEVATQLGISPDGKNGAAVIVEVASYFGRANPNLWTWIKTNWDRPKNG
jgi:hypothetical protein